mgnify:CR=1 FL=1
MTPPRPQTLDEAYEIIVAQARVIEQLQEKIRELEEQLRILKGGRPKDLTIRSFFKPNVRSKGAKPGPPLGHAAAVWTVPETIHEEREWFLENCPDCGGQVSEAVETVERIEMDVPPVSPVVRKHTMGRHWCGRCRKLVQAKAEGLLPHTPYGRNIHLLAAYLKYGLGMTIDKARDLFSEIYGLPMGSGVVSEMLMRVGDWMGPVHGHLKESLSLQSVIHADETGWRVSGENHWLWSFSGMRGAYYHIDRSRGQRVVADVLGEKFDGVLVTDFFGAYGKIEASKQKCWVHVLRDIKEMSEDFPQDPEVISFAKAIKRWMRTAFDLKDRWGVRRPAHFHREAHRIEQALLGWFMKPMTHPDIRRLQKRLMKYRKELFVFLRHKEVPAHNNNAERQIRPAVLMRKTSYQNRSQRGALTQAILMSAIQTCHKRKLNFMEWGKNYLAAIHSSADPPPDPFALPSPAL